MNKLLVPMALAAVLSAVPFVSKATDGQAFVNLGVGRGNYASSGLSKHTANAFDITGGYRWALSDNFALGGEAGYVRFGKAHGTSRRTGGGVNPATVTGPGPVMGTPDAVTGPGPVLGAAMPSSTATTRSKLRVDGPMVGANARVTFATDFFATGELGAYRAYSKLATATTVESAMIGKTVGTNVTRRTRNTRSAKAFGGVGLGYVISPNMDVSLNVDRFQAYRKNGGGVNLATVDVGVHF